MFPRGDRFPAEKISDVPGPGFYNPQEVQDEYKRGAFLEKADRFNKEKISDVPGPGTYAGGANGKPPVKKPTQSSNLNDRYAALQKKLEDLERVHADGKKAHNVAQDRLKQELSRAQRASTEQSELLAKSKKHADALDARFQELKKTSTADQAEVKDLRLKLRLSEHERTQLAAKQGEAGEAKKALQTLDAKRREDTKERDRKIAELEKALAAERRRNEALEGRDGEAKERAEKDFSGLMAQKSEAEAAALRAREEGNYAQAALEVLERAKEAELDTLLRQLAEVKALLSAAAEQYGALAAATVHKSVHAQTLSACAELEMQIARMGRKLANAEGQVVELAHLVRQTKEENAFLAAQTQDAEQEAAFYAAALRDASRASRPAPGEEDALIQECGLGQDALRGARREAQEVLLATYRHLHSAQRLSEAQVLLAYSIADQRLSELQTELQQRDTDLAHVRTAHEGLLADLAALRTAHEAVQHEVGEVTARLAEACAAEAHAKVELETAMSGRKDDATTHEATVKREKEATQRLAATLQKSRTAEEALKGEIEQLTTELMDAIPYQDAYANLYEEVQTLLAKNTLAEAETQRLSAFNAEILGHRNPAQKIMYVDRIRRELAETKQKLLASTREHEGALADNDALRSELGMFKSVAVPTDLKPRTGIIRVGRVPLVTQSPNVDSMASSAYESIDAQKPEAALGSEYLPGDMTLDEMR